MTIDAQGFFWFGSPLVAVLVAVTALGALALAQLGLTATAPAPRQVKALPVAATVRSRATLPLTTGSAVRSRAAAPRSARAARVPQARLAVERHAERTLAACGTRRVA
jgi:hypothetical protein